MFCTVFVGRNRVGAKIQAKCPLLGLGCGFLDLSLEIE